MSEPYLPIRTPSGRYAMERHLKAARQFRAETVTYGLARALEGISSLVRQMSERPAPLARHPWPEIHQPTPKT